MSVIPISESDLLPEARRIAALRDIPVAVKDVRFTGCLFLVAQRYPLCPKCGGRSCTVCGRWGRVKEILAAPLTEDAFRNRADFILRECAGDKPFGKVLWKEFADYNLMMECYDCRIMPQEHCKYCKGSQLYKRPLKFMKVWLENHGFDYLAAVSPKKSKKVKE